MPPSSLSEDAVRISGTVAGGYGTEHERAAIRSLASALDSALKKAGVGRCDGDEFGTNSFAIFLHGSNADEIYAIADSIIAAVKNVRLSEITKVYSRLSREVTIDWKNRHETTTWKPSKKRLEWHTGDVIAIPLLDTTRVVSQIVAHESIGIPSATCAIFDLRIGSEADLTSKLIEGDLIACLFVTPDLIETGAWPIIGRQLVAVSKKFLPYENTRKTGWVGAKVIGSRNVREFLEGYYSLRAWDDWADPSFCDKLLVNPAKRPVNLILRHKGV